MDEIVGSGTERFCEARARNGWVGHLHLIINVIECESF